MTESGGRVLDDQVENYKYVSSTIDRDGKRAP